MTSEEKIKLKALILSKIERLNIQIVDLKELTQPIEPDCAIGTISRMDAINNKSINESGLRKKIEQLNGLEYALNIFEQDDFEQCSVCGGQIPIGRLFIMPESRKCIHCANLKN